MPAVKWGVISTANINRLFLAGARQANGVEIAAVASRDRTRAEQYAREHEIPRAHGSYEELLQDPELLRRVSHCPGRGCGWLFLNTSGRRRWCSMSTCGSREKMRRLYQRQTQ